MSNNLRKNGNAEVAELVERAIVRKVSGEQEEVPKGYQSVGIIEVPSDDTDALAKAEALVARTRMARQERCTQAVNKALEDHNCQIQVAVRLGEQGVLLSQVLNLPAQILITSK